MEIQDPTGLLNPVGIAQFCGAHSYPAPVNVAFQGSRGRHAIYVMSFAAQSNQKPTALWLELATGVRGSALQIEHAAIHALKLAENIQAHTPFTTPPDYTIGHWAATRTAVQSVNGSEWVLRRPGDWHGLGRHLGKTVMALSDTLFPQYGFTAEGGRFLPSRGSWKQEWQTYVCALADRSVRTGVDMGSLATTLVEQINQRMDALDAVSQWSLVHGNLGPQSLELIPHGVNKPSVILMGWDDALIGDPLVEAGALLGLNPQQLAPVAAGMDEEFLSRWLDPVQLVRIELYHFTWCLAQLCTIGDFYSFDQDVTRLANLSRIRSHIHSALAPGFCKQRLQEALTLRAKPNQTWTLTSSDMIEAQLQVSLGVLASNQPMPPKLALISAASMAACHLAYTIDPENLPLRKGCLAIAIGNQTIKKARAHANDASIADLNAWKADLSRQISKTLRTKMVDTSALVAWWMGLETFARVQNEVSTATQRGLERLIRGSLHLAALQQGRSQDPLSRQLTYAVIGLGAIHGLRVHLGDDKEFSELREMYQEVLLEASQDLDLTKPATMESEWTLKDVNAGLYEDLDNTTQQALRPLLVLAMARMHGQEALPGGPKWVFANAGV